MRIHINQQAGLPTAALFLFVILNLIQDLVFNVVISNNDFELARNLHTSVIPNEFEQARNRTPLPTAQTFIQYRSEPAYLYRESISTGDLSRIFQIRRVHGYLCFRNHTMCVISSNNFERARNLHASVILNLIQNLVFNVVVSNECERGIL